MLTFIICFSFILIEFYFRFVAGLDFFLSSERERERESAFKIDISRKRVVIQEITVALLCRSFVISAEHQAKAR